MKRIESLAQQLVDSVAKNDFEKVKTLTSELKDNVNLAVKYGKKLERDALTEAVHQGNIKIVNYIANNYGNVNTHIDAGKYNALTEAISHSNKTLLKLLLEKANSDTKQRTLDYAIEEKETDIAEIISKSIVTDHQALFEVIEQIALNGEVSE